MPIEIDDDSAAWFHQEQLLHQQWETERMKMGEVSESNYLKQQDVDPPILVTIKDATRENVAMQGQPPDMVITLGFNETDKRLVLKATNKNRLHTIFGTNDNSDISELYGKKIVLYRDPNVEMQGRIVGGVRIRAPKPGSVPEQETQQPPAYDDDIPF